MVDGGQSEEAGEMDEAGRHLRIARIVKRLDRLSGDHWRGLAGELQRLYDLDPACANAHVAAYHAFHRDAVRRHVPAPGPMTAVRPLQRFVLASIEIDNPMLTEGLQDGNSKGETKIPERVEQPHNLVVMVGGFARVSGRTPEQTLAASRYRSLWEQSRLGTSIAMDYEAVRVDTSGPSEAAIWERGEDARRAYARAVRLLGVQLSWLVELVVCEEWSIRQAARKLEGDEGGAAQERTKRRLVEAVDRLVAHFRLGGAEARQHGKLRAEGDRASMFGSYDLVQRRTVPC